jgi:hypothetical protein
MLVIDNVVDQLVQDVLEDHVLLNRVVDWRLVVDSDDMSKYTFKNHIVHNMKVLSPLYNVIGKANIIDKIYALLPSNTGTWAIERGFLEFLPQGHVQEYTQDKIFNVNKDADAGVLENAEYKNIDPVASFMVLYFINNSNATIYCSDAETLPPCTKGSVAIFSKDQTFSINSTHASGPTALIALGIVDLQASKEQVRHMM